MRLIRLAATALLLSVASVSAQTTGGMGPVYQFLQSQGFSNIQIVRERNQIRVTALRGDQLRMLVWDARTGKLLWDNLNPDRDRTRDRLYLEEFDRDRDRDRLRDATGDKDQTRDQDQTRDPATH